MISAAGMEKSSFVIPLPEDNAVGSAGLELSANGKRQLDHVLSGSVFWAAKDLQGRAQSKLWKLSQLGSNWDSYGAPAPNTLSIQNAARILELMKPFDLDMATIVPSAEGGVGFCFVQGDRYADIESSNDGEMIGVRYTGADTPILIEVDGSSDSIEAALEAVRNHING